MTPPASSVLRAHPSNPITGTNPFSNANAVSQPTHLAPVAEVNSLESNRAPSASSTPSTVIPPNAPQTSPISGIQSPLESVVEEDIKRVSKPPPAPRLSRFPESPEIYDPQAHMNMDIPRPSERTMTMPPLPRQPTTTDPAPLSPPSLSQQNMHGNGNHQPAPSSHFNARNQPPYSAGIESTVASSGMGTSAGSNTPSTSQTGSSNQTGSFNRFTNAAPPQITRNGTFAGSTTNSNRPGTGDRRANKPGQVSFRALRTGSSTAGVGTLGR
ncbi:hypothetical protein CPB86DRAFT_795361 [Serendipita vermifera]|nr:hypothetical protein CPB86DRAFT_795361 [Serendipita vermifera]